MDELLTEDQSQLRESAARLGRDVGGAKRARALRDQGAALDAEAWAAMRQAGWLGLAVPEARGGLGLGAAELYVIAEQIGRHAVMVPIIEAAGVAWGLGRAGGGAGAAAALGALLAGRLIVPALQSDGWDFRRATAALEAWANGNALNVSGAVPLVPYAPAAEEFLVHAELAGEALLCVVSREAAGCTVSGTRLVDGSSAGSVMFDHASVAPSQIVARGQEAAELAARMADLLSLGAAIELMGLAESMLGLTLDHLKMRKQFGHALGSFQALQHRVVDCFVDLEVNRSLLHRICLAWDSGTALPAMVAAAKARCARVGNEVARTGVQLHGAIGYTDEHDIGILFKRALVLAARYGGELAQSERFARLIRDEA